MNAVAARAMLNSCLPALGVVAILCFVAVDVLGVWAAAQATVGKVNEAKSAVRVAASPTMEPEAAEAIDVCRTAIIARLRAFQVVQWDVAKLLSKTPEGVNRVQQLMRTGSNLSRLVSMECRIKHGSVLSVRES
jgi:hypothetical protein